jgi:hypothetical protein
MNAMIRQSWDTDYSSDATSFADGFGWTLMLEYDDRAVGLSLRWSLYRTPLSDMTIK